MPITYYCPKCKEQLQFQNHKYLCSHCNKKWNVRDEIPIFAEEEYYYGELPQNDMKKLVENSKNMVWSEIKKQIFGKNPWFNKYVFDESRADWRFLLPINEKSKILDLGCGWGTISVPISRMCCEVYAVDPVYERVQFVNIHRKAKNRNNIYPVCCNLDSLPFPNSYFDVIIMNGVLEWTPTSMLDGDPFDIQTKYLRMVHNLLKENGVFYLGIENRLGFHYFLGWRDDHSHLRFTTLLPRKIANMYSIITKKEPYRTYTYSFGGYKKMLNAVGFKKLSPYFPIPFYHTPSFMLPMKNGKDIKSSVKFFLNHLFNPSTVKRRMLHRVAKCFPKLKMMRQFYPSFIIIASKGQYPNKALILKIINKISGEKFPQIVDNNYFVSIKGRIGENSCVTFLVFDRKQESPIFIIKISRHPDTNKNLEREYNTILSVKGEINNRLAFSIPNGVGCGHICNHSYIAFKYITGETLANKIKHAKKNAISSIIAKYISLCFEWLVQFEKETEKRVIVDQKLLYEHVEKQIYKVSKLVDFKEQEKDVLFRMRKDSKHLLGTELPLICQHGDFMPNNVIIKEQGISIIDWEMATFNKLPFNDLLYLFFWLSALINSDEKLQNIEGSFSFAFIDNNWYSNIIKSRMERYSAILNIPKGHHKLFLKLFVINKMIVDIEYFRDSASASKWGSLFRFL